MEGFILVIFGVIPFLINTSYALWENDISLDDSEVANVTSPNYPNDYEINTDIRWRVIAPPGYRVMLHFVDLHIDDGLDYVTVYEGRTAEFKEAVQRIRISGSNRPPNITSVGSYLWLQFTSDVESNSKGFNALLSYIHMRAWNCSFGSFEQPVEEQDEPCSICLTERKSQPFYWFVTDKDSSFGENQPYFRAALNNPNNSEGVSAECTLLNASLPSGGLLSFKYIFNSRSRNERHGCFNYSVCKGEGTVHPLNVVDDWTLRQHSFNCSDVEISFKAVRGDNFTNVGIDDVDVVLPEVSLQSTSSTDNIQTLSATNPTTEVLSTMEETEPQTEVARTLVVGILLAFVTLYGIIITLMYLHLRRSKIALKQSVGDREGQELDPYMSIDATTMEQPAYEGIKASRHGKRGHTNAIEVAKYGNQRIVEQTARVKKSNIVIADENIEHEYELIP